MQPWRKIGGPARANESALEFVNEFTHSRMTPDYQMTQGGKTVYYDARRVSTRSESGPRGELVAATVVKQACRFANRDDGDTPGTCSMIDSHALVKAHYVTRTGS